MLRICQESLCLPYAKKKINYRTDTKELNVENICQASDVEDVLCLPRAMLRTFPISYLTVSLFFFYLPGIRRGGCALPSARNAPDIPQCDADQQDARRALVHLFTLGPRSD